ncbi:putative porin [Methylomagnum sp.]
MIARNTLAALLAGSLASTATAAPNEEYLPVKKSTFVNLLDLLVQKGVIEKKDAKGLVKEAEEEAKAEARKEQARAEAEAKAASGAEAAGAAAESAAATGQPGKGKAGSKSIHVGYVPEFVKKEIRDEVRAELKADVLKDARQTAVKEKWAFSDLIPGWVNRIHPYIDARVRFSDEFFASDNAQFFDWMAVNRENTSGGLSEALARNTAIQNTTHDRLRINERFRVGFDADIAEGLKAGFRLTTTNIYSPVSTNQNLGNYNQTWIVALDRAYLQYDFMDAKGNDWFSLWGGRIANPFMSTEMQYSAMLSFEGLVGTFRYRFNQDDPTVAAYHAPSATGRYGVNLGPQSPDTVFATFGVLPLQEVNLSSSDKWLFAAQVGADWLVHDESRLKMAAAYYDYKNVYARRNGFDSHAYDWTAPDFMQRGNSLVAINDAKNQPGCNTGSLGAQNVCLVGLASGFQVMDITAAFDYAGFAPTHVLLTADYAKNFGFNASRIFNQFGDRISPKTNAYMVRLDVGRPEVRHFNDWNVFFSYRYIERDAVLDAFNDPIFHQGGTNIKGWTIGGQYAIATNTWLDLRWLSADQIDGPPLGIDTLNLDINAKF